MPFYSKCVQTFGLDYDLSPVFSLKSIPTQWHSHSSATLDSLFHSHVLFFLHTELSSVSKPALLFILICWLKQPRETSGWVMNPWSQTSRRTLWDCSANTALYRSVFSLPWHHWANSSSNYQVLMSWIRCVKNRKHQQKEVWMWAVT